ncbi:MAG: hypothetical protein HY902_13240 [Deltaproteobacteria bacterium]|nr:hypothetical protein [Deltaproteobacteria bacterium]
MTTALEPVAPKDEYADLLAELNLLSREMLLAFRLQAGKVFLDRFFSGSAHAYRDKSPHKEATFVAFSTACKVELAEVGISANLARQCILAHIAWEGLPPGVRDSLKFNHVVALARVEEPNTRARLAFDATRQGWSVVQLEDAIARADDGHYYDTDPDTAGTQPPAPKPAPAVAYQPGRLVTQLAKSGRELKEWRAAWASVDASRLRGAQRQRCLAALQELKAQVAQLEADLAAGK